MTQPRFVHLRTHSDFSMIDGIAKVKPLVKACARKYGGDGVDGFY